MDNLSQPIDQDIHGPSLTRQLVRRDTASSAGSDGYTPLLAGHWTLNIRGNCPRCHHHHNAVKIKINVSSDLSRVSRVRCERCLEQWLSFAGNNSTQISLLSTASTQPDPVVKEVRLTLASIVKSATTITAIGSPTLARIPELSSDYSGEPSTSAVPATGLQPVPPTLKGPVEETLQTLGDYAQVPTDRPPPSPTVRSAIQAHDASTPRRLLAYVKQKLKARIPEFRRLRLRQLVRNSKRSRSPPTRGEKAPVGVLTPVRRSVSKEFLSAHNSEPQHADPPVLSTTPKAEVDTSNLSEEAARFIEAVKDESVDLTNKERAAWIRKKITQFKTQHARSGTMEVRTTDTGTQVLEHELPDHAFVSGMHLQDFIAIGNHVDYSDRSSASGPSLRVRSISISERTSECATVIDGAAVANAQMYTRFMQREHARSGSPRPPSVHAVSRSRQQSLQRRVDARSSFESNTTGGIVGEASSSREWALRQWTQSSIGRLSMLRLNQMPMSQTSLHRIANQEEHTITEPESSPPPSTSPPPPPSTPQSPIRRTSP